jgi:hypothetical protein
LEIPDYCREIESFLCRKNDGHLIRIVGPSFDLVSGWAGEGIPLKIALQGIERYFERYYRKGPRRRPVRIDFCDDDVRDVFDEWRRAVGIVDARVGAAEPAGEPAGKPAGEDSPPPSGRSSSVSLPAHLERALRRLTTSRATGKLGDEADPLIDRVSSELDVARSSPGGVRGQARRELLGRLEALDDELKAMAERALTASQRDAIEGEARDELAEFRGRLDAAAFERAHAAAVARLAREHFGIPVLTL